MSFKTFGRLAGKTPAASALNATAAANTTTPYDVASPASKFIAYGEDGQSLTFNRALGALAANTDYLHALLGSPAMRADLLTPVRSEGGKAYGFTALSGVVSGAAQIDLGVGARRPVQWVYLGLHKDRLGEYIKLYRRSSTARANGDYSSPADNNDVSPTDARLNAAASSFFPTQTYVGSEEHALVDKIPPIYKIAADLPPYAAASPARTIASWDADGLYVTVLASDAMYLRPGCFVEVFNEISPTTNNGLWRIEDIRRASATDPAGDKLILSRGGVHRVTLTSTANFNAGERVTWRSRPDGAGASTAEQREHYAYIVYKIGNDLYLADFAGGEDFKVQGGNIAYKADETAASYRGFKHVNHVGAIDLEADATQNWSLTIGTQLYSVGGGSFSGITAIVGAGHPVQFSTASTVGSFYPCSPLGWAINPTLLFGVNTITGGDYYADCFTLTTAREQMVSQGAGPARGVVEAPFTQLGLSRNAMHALRGSLKFLHTGSNASFSPDTLNGPLSAAKQIVGEQLWKITVVDEANPATEVNQHVFQGSSITLAMPAGVTVLSANTTAVVVNSDANNKLILKEVTRIAWSFSENYAAAPIIAGAPGGGSTFVADGKTFRVTAIDLSPALVDEIPNEYYPDFGLHAAYNAQYSAIRKERGGGRGNWIALVSGKPLTLIQAGGVGLGLDAYTVLDDRIDAGMLSLRTYAGDPRAHVKYLSGSLAFKDFNTPADIPLSDAAPFNALPAGAASIIEALHNNVVGAPGITGPWSASVLGGAVVSLGVGPSSLKVSVTAGYYIHEGVKIFVPAASEVVTLVNGTFYLAYDAVTGLYGLELGIYPDFRNSVFLHKFVVFGGLVVLSTDIRIPLRRVDSKLELTVGLPADPGLGLGTYPPEVANFSTLSAAFRVIQVWEDDVTAGYKIPWSIRVIGGVNEVVANLPMTIPADGMVIHGAPDLEHAIVWADGGADYNGALFNMNGRSGTTFRDLHFRYIGDTATLQGVNLNRIVWDGRVGDSLEWTIDNVTVSAATPERLHGYLSTIGRQTDRLRIRNCRFVGASDFGIALGSAFDVHIENSIFEGESLNPQAVSGGTGAIVINGNGSTNGPVWVTNCRILSWQLYGVAVVNCPDATVSNNVIARIDADTDPTSPVAAYGIHVSEDSLRANVSNNRLYTIGATAFAPGYTAMGINIEGRAIVGGNDAALDAAALAGAGTIAGINLTATSTNCIVTANQTNAAGVWDAGVANTTANNRDDV